ncbi:MAG: DUF507 family protein [Thermodesulfovibrionales bacterium]
MRIPKTWVPLLTRRIIDNLVEKDLVELKLSKDKLIEESEKIVLEELMIEDRLNEEVREILKKFSADIEKGRLDYRKLFEMTKKKIVEERGLIL